MYHITSNYADHPIIYMHVHFFRMTDKKLAIYQTAAQDIKPIKLPPFLQITK
jgi:hypothetical protein